MQRTLKGEVSYEGVGLHSGKLVSLTMRRGKLDSGIIFIRTDIKGEPKIRARASNVTATMRATTLEENGAKVFTIEHIMSALSGLNIDNCEILLNSEEPPVADGSSKVFVDLIKKAGVLEEKAKQRSITVDKVYRIDENGKFIIALPYDGFRISFTSVNPHPLIGVQYKDFEISEKIYEEEIAGARTIAYEKEVAALKEMGLGLGGTLENVIVYNDEGWLNPLRYKDELARHKILDVMGDLKLAGNIRGHIIAAASGHALNTKLAKTLEKECMQ